MAAVITEFDVVALLWLGWPPCGGVSELAAGAGVSTRVVEASLARLARAGLYSHEVGRVLTGPALEFLVHGARFCFPAEADRERTSVGVPTAWSADPLAAAIVGAADPLVWSVRGGTVRGSPVKPIHAAVPALALVSKAFHARASLFDALRLGRVRDRAEASRLLTLAMAA